MSTNSKKNYYSRQLKLIGDGGQDALNNARVLVIGAGGLGCPVLLYIGAMGIGNIGIIDHDKVDITNLHRQVLFTPDDVGEFKSQVAAKKIAMQNPNIITSFFTNKLNLDNAEAVFKNYDYIIDCTDNFETKFLVHDFCFIQKKILIQASIYQYEGNLHVFDFSYDNRKHRGPCLRCLWTREPEDGSIGTCAEVGVIGATAGVLGSLQAMEVCKIILGKMPLKNGEGLFVDLTTHDYEKRSWKKNNECILCGNSKNFRQLNESYKISLDLVTEEYFWIDLRNSEEIAGFTINKAHVEQISISNFHVSKLDMTKKYVLVCQKGFRSNQIARALREEGHENIFSLIDGILHLR